MTLATYSRRTLDWARQQADRPHLERDHRHALNQVAAIQRDLADAPIWPDMPDSEIRRMAARRAERMAELISQHDHRLRTIADPDWLQHTVESLDAKAGALAWKPGQPLAPLYERAQCVIWWRRQLRRAVVRMYEGEAVAAGRVGVRTRQPYVSNMTNERVRERRQANRAMLAATELENEAGQVMTLEELAATSVANPAIRRGELMTRIAGCEKLADTLGHRGVFLTLTAPSRFHSNQGDNKNYRGATPRDAHEWLCTTWARARARLHRLGVRFYGFRVAEPHKDGCPHWHAMLWAESRAALAVLVMNLRQCWLKDAGDEAGAREHRLKAKLMEPGGAAGYCAKYVAKNIDDAGAVGTEGHTDYDATTGKQVPLVDGTAARVQAWASAWGIRQFQAIGQPPVTVWRELRRVAEQDRAGASPRMADAFTAVHRDGERRANWALYVIAQGGLMVGRDYLVRIHKEQREKAGRYELSIQAVPVGVLDVETPGQVHHSTRREWKPKGQWGARVNGRAGETCASGRTPAALARPAVHPWTRFNNCTHGTVIDGRLKRRGEPLSTWLQQISAEPGGSSLPERAQTWIKPPTTPHRLALLRTHSPTWAL